MGQNVAIIILFILIAGGAYAFYKHTHNKSAHKSTIAPPTTPASGGAGSGGIAGKQPVEKE